MTTKETTAAPNKRRLRPVAWLFALLLVAAMVAGVRYEAIQRWKWAALRMPDRMARVGSVWNVTTLARRLQDAHKLRDVPTFLIAAQEVGLTEAQPGGYYLPPVAGPLDLARAFKAGPTHLKVTFPEGFTAEQIAARLQRSGFVHAEDLLHLAYPEAGFSHLEGRLYPDTYLLRKNASAHILAEKFEDRFTQVTNTLPRPFPSVSGKPLTLLQLTTLASIVEREARAPEDMPLVAGVLLNRLNTPMRLQVDATVEYGLILQAMAGQGQGRKTRLTDADLKLPSPFNTYLIDGLPPEPICNPGAQALLAAARPTWSNYLFYVYSPLLKRHRFAATFAGHQQNIRLAIQERQALEAAKAAAAAPDTDSEVTLPLPAPVMKP